MSLEESRFGNIFILRVKYKKNWRVLSYIINYIRFIAIYLKKPRFEEEEVLETSEVSASLFKMTLNQQVKELSTTNSGKLG